MTAIRPNEASNAAVCCVRSTSSIRDVAETSQMRKYRSFEDGVANGLASPKQSVGSVSV
jgi:hypothetical protein